MWTGPLIPSVLVLPSISMANTATLQGQSHKEHAVNFQTHCYVPYCMYFRIPMGTGVPDCELGMCSYDSILYTTP